MTDRNATRPTSKLRSIRNDSLYLFLLSWVFDCCSNDDWPCDGAGITCPSNWTIGVGPIATGIGWWESWWWNVPYLGLPSLSLSNASASSLKELTCSSSNNGVESPAVTNCDMTLELDLLMEWLWWSSRINLYRFLL